MAKGEGNPKDDRDEEERMKRIMKAATGYETIEEARTSRPTSGAARDDRAITSAREFLEDMEDEVNQDVASAGHNVEIIAPDQKDDMKLNSVLIGGPAPKPPERRKDLHSHLKNSLNSARGTDQSVNLMDPSMARRRSSGQGWGKTGLTSRLFGRSNEVLDADPSKDSEEYILAKHHMVRYYNFICFLVVCILTMVSSTLFVMYLMSRAPEPIEQTTQDGNKGISDFGSPVPAPVANPVSTPVSAPTTAPVSAPTTAPVSDETASLGRFEEIMSRLVDTGFAEESKLRNGVTAQFKALDWLASHDPASLDPSSEDLLPRYVLAVLFYSTSGRPPKLASLIRTSWKKHELWLSGGSYCEWHGIKCVGEDDYFVKEGNGTIFQINLVDNNLKGEIPTELAALSDLHSLNLRSNRLSGPIPAEFKFPAIKDIYLDYNYLNGTIDALQLEHMKELHTLSMPYNELTGTIPASIGFANKLRYIKLGGNQLTGNFPSTMASLTNLQTLHVSRNKLNGTIPDHFFEMKRLVNVSMSQNLFEGKLSTKLSQLSHLQELHLTGNDFSGTVPDAFDSMILLATLHLGENRLSGEVPKSLGSRHRLEKLDLTSNDFVGTMPQEICELKETGKLYHLGADCVVSDNTALDVSALGDNRRQQRRRLLEDPDDGKPKVRGGFSRLGGSFAEEEPEDEDGDAEVVLEEPEEEEVINKGDFVYMEEDGTFEDKDGNVIEGVAIEDLEDLDTDVDPVPDEEVIDQGDFVYLEEDGTVEDKDGNVIEGVAMEDLEDLDADAAEEEEEEEELYLEEDGTVEDKDGNIIEGVALEDLEVVEEDGDGEDGEEELYLEEDGTVEDKDGNIIEGIALEDLEIEEDPEGNIAYAQRAPKTVALNVPEEDEDEQVLEFTQPLEGEDDEREDEDGNKIKIAYASSGVAVVDRPEEMAFSGIECPCCTFCLTATASSSTIQNGRSANIPQTQGPVNSPACSAAIQEGNGTDGYPGLVGMNASDAKKCLQDNTNKTVIITPAVLRRQYPYDSNRIIVFVDRDRNVKKPPKVG